MFLQNGKADSIYSKILSSLIFKINYTSAMNFEAFQIGEQLKQLFTGPSLHPKHSKLYVRNIIITKSQSSIKLKNDLDSNAAIHIEGCKCI